MARPATGLKLQRQSVMRVSANLRKLRGHAKSLVGRLTEGQHYAVYVEFGTTTMRARPHMRPAFARMLRMALPILKEYAKDLTLDGDAYDRRLRDGLWVAMNQMEAYRQDALEELVYSQPESPTYVRTGLLRRNRVIEVTARGAPGLRKVDRSKGGA